MMSRTRIVKGRYTKIVGGDYNISSEGNIISNAGVEVTEKGSDNGVLYGTFERKGSNVNEDFDLQFSLKKDGEFSTLVPFGILDFNGNSENAFFAFNFSLLLSNVDLVKIEISDSEGNQIYSMGYLPEIVVTARRLPNLKEKVAESKPEYDFSNPVKTWDWQPIYQSFNVAPSDYTKIGSYVILWDGFDNNEVFDSTNYNGKTLKAKITAQKNGVEKSKEIEFSTSYKEVDWVDVKIDKKNKKIDTTLRVNLKDGGAEGLNCTTTDVDPDPKFRVPVSSCDWDKIPPTAIIVGKAPIQSRTRSFSDLEKLAIDGLNYYWGRNQNHAVAKDVKIVSDAYEVNTNAVNANDNAMDDLSLVYNTNGDWMRSGNPGSATANPISWIGNLISREAVCYNVGYIKYSNAWAYQLENEEDIDFKETSAHEIGHEILKSFGGTVYSYGHKGSVNVVTQSNSSQSTNYPASGEIDIMPYYNNHIPLADRSRMAAAEKDVLGLIWLTKIKIK